MSLSSAFKEYTVRLGFKINKSEFSRAKGEVDSLKGFSSEAAKALAKNIGKQLTAVIGVAASATAAVAGLVNSVAQADLAIEKAARERWMNEESFRAIDASLKSMGMTIEQLNDIALNPELSAQFAEMYEFARSLKAPEGLNENLKLVRSITFEINKLKTYLNYLWQNVVYYLTEWIKPALIEIKAFAQRAISFLKDNMPQIAQKIAYLLYVVIRLVQVVFNIVSGIFKIIMKIPKGVKIGIVGALAAVMVALNPILAAIIFIFLLIEDYMTYKAGGKSLFAELWGRFDGDNETLNNLKASFDALGDSLERIGDALEPIKNKFKELYDIFDSGKSPMEKFADNLEKIANILAFIINGIGASATVIEMLVSILSHGTIGNLSSIRERQKGYVSGMESSAYRYGEIISDYAAPFVSHWTGQDISGGDLMKNWPSGNKEINVNGTQVTFNVSTNDPQALVDKSSAGITEALNRSVGSTRLATEEV